MGTINLCSFPFSFILSLYNEIDAFIFHPHGCRTKHGKELHPSLGLMILKSTFVEMPFIVVSTFLQTPMGSISPWSANWRYMPNSYSRGLPSCSHVSRVIIFTCEPKSSTTCRTWYPLISRSTSGSTSLLSFWFRLHIFLVFFLYYYHASYYNKSMN